MFKKPPAQAAAVLRRFMTLNFLNVRLPDPW